MSLDLRKIFAIEFEEYIDKLERLLSNDAVLTRSDLKEIFRIFHTLKGSSSLAGYENVKIVAQHYEKLLSEQLNATEVSPKLPGELLKALDELMDRFGKENCSDDKKLNELKEAKQFSLKLYPDKNSFHRGLEPISIIKYLKSISTSMSIRIDDKELPNIKMLDPTQMYLGWILEFETEFSEDQLRKKMRFALKNNEKSSLEQLNNRSSHSDKNNFIENISESLRIENDLSEQLLKVTLGLTSDVNRLIYLGRKTADESNIFMESMLKLKELQELALKIRAVPISALHERMKRLIRKLSISAKKEVTLEFSGGEVEIDKSIMDQLSPNIEHLIRNSIDHGIETPEERIKQNKKASGLLKMSTIVQSDRIVFTISDDGKGIDSKKVLEKAKKMGLESTSINPLEIIFTPGFSLAEKITDTSGRGIGMDAVRKTVERLGGSFKLSSEVGKGTVYKLHIPVKISVFDSALIRSGKSIYAIPLFNIVKCLPVTRSNIGIFKEKRIFHVDKNTFVPIVLFGKPNLEKIVIHIKTSSGEKYAILADEFVSVEQVVLRPSGDETRTFENLLGFTKTGSGNIVPVINTENIFRKFKSNTRGWTA